MSDDDSYSDLCRELREKRRERRAKYGADCPGCRKKEPNRIPSILLPQQKCKVCGYRDPRKRGEAPPSPDNLNGDV